VKAARLAFAGSHHGTEEAAGAGDARHDAAGVGEGMSKKDAQELAGRTDNNRGKFPPPDIAGSPDMAGLQDMIGLCLCENYASGAPYRVVSWCRVCHE
jgi:hypothetical protein